MPEEKSPFPFIGVFLRPSLPEGFFLTLNREKEEKMNRIALLGIIVEEMESSGKINEILHEYASLIVGRMGIPYREKGIAIISVIIDAPQEITSALSGKLGNLPGVQVKTVYSKKEV